MWTPSLLAIDKEREVNLFRLLGWTLVSAVLLYLCGFFNVFHWPQITWLCLTSIGTVTGFYRHGEKTKTTAGIFLFSLALILFIYIKGGAFQYLNH